MSCSGLVYAVAWLHGIYLSVHAHCLHEGSTVRGVFVCGRWFGGWMPADDHIALIGDAAGLALAAMVHLEKRY